MALLHVWSFSRPDDCPNRDGKKQPSPNIYTVLLDWKFKSLFVDNENTVWWQPSVYANVCCYLCMFLRSLLLSLGIFYDFVNVESLCVCVCVCVCVCACVCERERERERVSVRVCVHALFLFNFSVNLYKCLWAHFLLLCKSVTTWHGTVSKAWQAGMLYRIDLLITYQIGRVISKSF